jgi:hypothetical protein
MSGRHYIGVLISFVRRHDMHADQNYLRSIRSMEPVVHCTVTLSLCPLHFFRIASDLPLDGTVSELEMSM